MLFFAVCVVALALVHGQHTSSQQADHMFTLIDADRDGMMSMAELDHVFQHFDHNGDRRITMHEFYTAFCHADRHLCLIAGDLFKDLDSQHTLILMEDNLAGTYAIFDGDANGEVTKSEFHAYMVKELDALKANQKFHIPFF